MNIWRLLCGLPHPINVSNLRSYENVVEVSYTLIVT